MEMTQAERPSTPQSVNLGNGERITSIVVGSGLMAFGLARRTRLGWSLVATGATLLYRGLRGNCAVYRALGINRAGKDEGRRGNLGVKVERELSIEEPAVKLYGFWRDFRVGRLRAIRPEAGRRDPGPRVPPVRSAGRRARAHDLRSLR